MPSAAGIFESGTFCPPVAVAPYFNHESKGWVFSRYADVLAVLREPALQQASEPSEPKTKTPARVEASAAISYLNLGEMGPLMAPSIEALIDQLPANRTVDLVSELFRPWCVDLLIAVVGIENGHRYNLPSLARYASGGEMDPRKAFLRARIPQRLPELVLLTLRQKKADAAFDRFSKDIHLPGMKSVFLGITQTLLGFLSNAWLALLQHPEEVQRLRARPDLMTTAIEELLRYAGLVHTLTRRASVNVTIAGVNLSARQRVFLKIASANHDPAQFHEPERLMIDRPVARREIAQLALGAGPHSCVGASFVRMAGIAATRALVERITQIHLAGSIEWSRGSVLSYPLCLPVVIRSNRYPVQVVGKL